MVDTTVNVWDKSVPVEKSSYLRSTGAEYFNLDRFIAPQTNLTLLDLFCGAGGFSVGSSWAGFAPVFGIDYLEPAIKTWALNHPNAIGCLSDIANLKPSIIKTMLENKGVSKVSLITGGVPCQGFSRANRKQNHDDERNYLFLEYMKYVSVFCPDYIILENVSGMSSTAGGRFVSEILAYMTQLGYCPTVRLLNAVEYGVPQVRKRLIFVGVKKNAGLTEPYSFPEGAFQGTEKYRTAWDAISDLPKLGNNQSSKVYSTPPLSEYQSIMRGEGPLNATVPDQLYNHVSPNHPESTIIKIGNTEPGKPMYPKFKQRIRLRYDQPSPTQLAGGIRPQFQFGHPDQNRGLTIRERARIQSFPDSYVFMGGIVQERVQTGNAVPPLMIHEITKPIAKDIMRRDKEKT